MLYLYLKISVNRGEPMKRTAYCKINLTLEILGTKRGDGFHDIKTVMHKIPLGDEIELFAKEGSGNIDFSCDSNLCPPEDNLAYRAAEKYLEAYTNNTGKNADIVIRLSKITPAGAGLGGGSADAATVLDMLQTTLPGVSDEEILELASLLGSDVPFCLGRFMSAYCSGRGEACRSIETLPQSTCIVIAKPLEGINTKGIYGEYDKKYGDDYSKTATDNMEKALSEKDIFSVADGIMNDFESVCVPRLPEIDYIKKRMKQAGALCAQMSGSGSAVFGLFDDEKKCKACFDELKEEGLKEIFCFDDADFQKMYKGE